MAKFATMLVVDYATVGCLSTGDLELVVYLLKDTLPSAACLDTNTCSLGCEVWKYQNIRWL